LFDEDALGVGNSSSRPHLLTLRRVDVENLTLSDLDLSGCIFAGAHHLDKIRIEGPRPFADTPGPWVIHVGTNALPIWRRWTRRQALAEEHHWRSQIMKTREGAPVRQPEWNPAGCRTPQWVNELTGSEVQVVAPDRLAGIYRSLRKAQEDGKDEPGAADFYYGEMEMRRKSQSTSRSERFILWLYWLMAGYGLRGLRALLWLAVSFATSILLMHEFGFPSRESWGSAFLYTAGALTRLVSPRTGLLNQAGDAIRIIIGVLGPILLGLAIISVRNRVKR
jgi:hypothetical protein